MEQSFFFLPVFLLFLLFIFLDIQTRVLERCKKQQNQLCLAFSIGTCYFQCKLSQICVFSIKTETISEELPLPLWLWLGTASHPPHALLHLSTLWPSIAVKQQHHKLSANLTSFLHIKNYTSLAHNKVNDTVNHSIHFYQCTLVFYKA